MSADNCPWPHCRRAFVYFISWALVGGQLYPASSIWGIDDVPYIFRRRNSPDISAHVQQPSLLNIDLHSTIREQQVQTSNIISTDKYNPVRVIHQIHVNTSNATYIYIQTAMLGTREYTLCSHFRANAHNSS